jgi:hypothetical protein
MPPAPGSLLPKGFSTFTPKQDILRTWHIIASAPGILLTPMVLQTVCDPLGRRGAGLKPDQAVLRLAMPFADDPPRAWFYSAN